MRRAGWRVLWALAGLTWGGTPAASAQVGVQWPLRLPLAHEMRAADTVWVSRWAPDPGRPDSGSTDSTRSRTPRWRALPPERVDSAWSRSFLDVLERSTFRERGRCEWDSLALAPDRVSVSLAGAGGRYLVDLELARNCGQLYWDARSVGSFRFDPDDARELLALVDRAPARDSMLAGSSQRPSAPATAAGRGAAGPGAPDPARGAGASRPAPGAAPADPRFGEYVFVEELPEAIHKVPPDYPEWARRAGVDGTVTIKALVGRDGRVEDARVSISVPALDASALQCVRQWIFKPAMAGGAPVAVWVVVPVKFILH